MKDQIYKKPAMISLIVASMLLFTSIVTTRVFAGGNVPVTVDIPVTYIVNGNDKTAGGDSFTLTADDPGSPMPDDAEAGKKTITIRKEGTYSFGNMYYNEPGVHWYTITRDAASKKGVVKDDSVYRAKVIALNDGHGYVLVYKKGSDKKHELVYTDRTAPETGDDTKLFIYCGLAVIAGAALVSMILFKRFRRKEKNIA